MEVIAHTETRGARTQMFPQAMGEIFIPKWNENSPLAQISVNTQWRMNHVLFLKAVMLFNLKIQIRRGVWPVSNVFAWLAQSWGSILSIRMWEGKRRGRKRGKHTEDATEGEGKDKWVVGLCVVLLWSRLFHYRTSGRKTTLHLDVLHGPYCSRVPWGADRSVADLNKSSQLSAPGLPKSGEAWVSSSNSDIFAQIMLPHSHMGGGLQTAHSIKQHQSYSCHNKLLK